MATDSFGMCRLSVLSDCVFQSCDLLNFCSHENEHLLQRCLLVPAVTFSRLSVKNPPIYFSGKVMQALSLL